MAVKLFSYVDAKNLEPDTVLAKSLLLSESRESAESKDVFLSHSTKDDHLVPGVIRFLKSFEATVYSDNFDTRLPNPPSTETANILKDEIKACRRLVVIATPNSHTSRWIPWELGLGDGFKGVAKNAIIPITPKGEEEQWTKTEYFGLYPRIINIEDQWCVFDPRDSKWWKLRDWLS